MICCEIDILTGTAATPLHLARYVREVGYLRDLRDPAEHIEHLLPRRRHRRRHNRRRRRDGEQRVDARPELVLGGEGRKRDGRTLRRGLKNRCDQDFFKAKFDRCYKRFYLISFYRLNTLLLSLSSIKAIAVRRDHQITSPG